ncbi:uncharacterized protein BT62DRAFT_922015 [Guyanagaster necrorhizus]|uniref:Uncharacterized protein n=1 Tax=Guyanagaster necrorhizus TaxID=856835 RepID=A0A9P7VL92_9AGAR|nr:uncharacterized protein BT62DRAFT_922015 [Guyanagaster necrorhizus MCA 3950]KAG7443206.1 hypothetical protein BT62DRAFT_922015 [Guyanagaster necrorhizus MCA 3950]
MVIIGPGITGIICTILADSTMIWHYWIVWGQHWLSILPPVLFLLSATAFKIIFVYQDYMEINYEKYIITFSSYNSVLLVYFDFLAAITKGIAPTLLVGHVAAGHAHSDDSWQGSVISGSLHFGTHPGGQSSQQDSMISIDLESQQEIGDAYGHQNPASSEENSASGIQENDLEVAQQERDIIYSHHTLAESQTDVGINSEGVIQKHDSELEQERERERERDEEYSHCMLKSSREDIGIESVILKV